MASEVADRIKLARIGKGLSQKALADLVGVSRPAVSQWEAGSIPEKPRMEALAAALDVDEAWLSGFGDKESPRKAYSQGSLEASLIGAMSLDWRVMARVCGLIRNSKDFNRLAPDHQADTLKRLYIIGVKEPAKLTGAAISTISLSVS